MLYRNLPLKLAAAGLAISLWFWVTVNGRSSGQTGGFRARAQAISATAVCTVGVIVPTEGALPHGLRLVSVQVQPSTVTIVGAAFRLSDLRRVATVPLDLRGASASFTRELPLVLPPGVRAPGNTSVTVTVTLARTGPGATGLRSRASQ